MTNACIKANETPKKKKKEIQIYIILIPVYCILT